MKNFVTVLLLLVGLAGFASETNQNTKKIDCEAIMQTGDQTKIAQSGCCSWHGGVCGCSNGRAACCDGALSPSCGCNSIVPIDNTQPSVENPKS